MFMDAHVGGGGVKNPQNHAHVINGRPLSTIMISQNVFAQGTIHKLRDQEGWGFGG